MTQKDRTAYLAVVDGLNPEALPSMAQDVLAHRKTEVEAFAGQVIQLAEFYGMAVPVTGTCTKTSRPSKQIGEERLSRLTNGQTPVPSQKQFEKTEKMIDRP